jgi:hypothetical protein
VIAVEVDLERDFLERAWKLILICEKIRRTMHGRAKVIIENARCDFISIHAEATMQRLVAMARVTCWDEVRWVWMPAGFHLGKGGLCRVMAGMRGSQTIVDQDGLWFEGSDGTHQFRSVRLSKEWVKQELGGSAYCS